MTDEEVLSLLEHGIYPQFPGTSVSEGDLVAFTYSWNRKTAMEISRVISVQHGKIEMEGLSAESAWEAYVLGRASGAAVYRVVEIDGSYFPVKNSCIGMVAGGIMGGNDPVIATVLTFSDYYSENSQE
ncbi:hypothetical protein JW766_06235 [Candidatus Dojkabacteria bacterium]|nr:hypothetical protein [Candidatus Dojkabacteria bacterium]